MIISATTICSDVVLRSLHLLSNFRHILLFICLYVRDCGRIFQVYFDRTHKVMFIIPARECWLARINVNFYNFDI